MQAIFRETQVRSSPWIVTNALRGELGPSLAAEAHAAVPAKPKSFSSRLLSWMMLDVCIWACACFKHLCYHVHGARALL